MGNLPDADFQEESCPFELWDLTPDQMVVWRWAYHFGRLGGLRDGWTAADEHAARLHDRAYSIVQEAANWPNKDPEERARIRVAQDEMRWRLWPEQMRNEQAMAARQ